MRVDGMNTLAALHAEIRACSTCFPDGDNQPVVSEPRPCRVIVIGQAPSRTDEATGRPFSGRGGSRLRDWLQQADCKTGDVYFSALTKCFPGACLNGKGDRVPTREEVRACRPFLVREVALVESELVVLVGGVAIREFMGSGSLDSRIGKAYPVGQFKRLAAVTCGCPNARWVVPLPHCSGVSLWLNNPRHRALLDRALTQIRTLLAHGNPSP